MGVQVTCHFSSGVATVTARAEGTQQPGGGNPLRHEPLFVVLEDIGSLLGGLRRALVASRDAPRNRLLGATEPRVKKHLAHKQIIPKRCKT